jgi:hypothetical protein
MVLRLNYLAIALASSSLVFACSSSDDSDDNTAGTGGSGESVVTGGSGGGETGGTGGGETGGTGGGETGGTGGGETGGTGGGATGGTGGGTTGGYGSLTTVSFTSSFILDGSKLTDQTYLQGHQNAFQPTPAFTGTYTSAGSPIPPSGATQTIAVASHMANPPSVGIIQQSFSGQTVASPMVQLQFMSDVLASGPVAVGMEQTSGAQLTVMDITGPQTGCIAAIGIGDIQVTNAVSTNQTEGGQLALQGANIALYHPSDTPYGNIQADLEAQMPVCPFK